jgi:hypothetical protein
MKPRTRAGAVALAAAVGALGISIVGMPANAAGSPPPAAKAVATGLNGPFGIQSVGRHGFVVAEADAGQVTLVSRTGAKRVIFNGAPGVAGVAASRHYVFGATGGPDETGAPSTGTYPQASVIRSDWRGKHVKVIADLLKYELRHNPDHQPQFDESGKPYADALSNPFSMNLSRFGLLVADGGANDVLKVDPRTGHVRTFFVPPTVKDVAACLEPGAQVQPGVVGCDPVPTGIAVNGDSVYISTLGAEVPGAGRVYQLNGRTGHVQHVWKGLTAPTGIAVSPRGTIYVSEVIYGAPEGDGPPPADFDPASVGRITRISHGKMTHSQVTMPTGLQFTCGQLYASSWSVAGEFLGIPDAGQLVRVNLHSFS